MSDQPNWRDPRIANNYLKNIQKMYLEKPGIKITTQLIMSVFAVAFFTFFAIRPTLSTITSLIKKIDDQKIVDQKLDTKLAQLSEASLELVAYETAIPLVSKAIPTTADLDGFMRRLEIIANEESAELTSLQFQAVPLVGESTNIKPVNPTEAPKTTTTENKNDRFVTFSFTINGNQQSILSFLQKVEQLDRAVAITKISFNKPPLQQQKFYQLTVSGKGTIYYQAAQSQ